MRDDSFFLDGPVCVGSPWSTSTPRTVAPNRPPPTSCPTRRHRPTARDAARPAQAGRALSTFDDTYTKVPDEIGDHNTLAAYRSRCDELVDTRTLADGDCFELRFPG